MEIFAGRFASGPAADAEMEERMKRRIVALRFTGAAIEQGGRRVAGRWRRCCRVADVLVSKVVVDVAAARGVVMVVVAVGLRMAVHLGLGAAAFRAG